MEYSCLAEYNALSWKLELPVRKLSLGFLLLSMVFKQFFLIISGKMCSTKMDLQLLVTFRL